MITQTNRAYDKQINKVEYSRQQRSRCNIFLGTGHFIQRAFQPKDKVRPMGRPSGTINKNVSHCALTASQTFS